MGILSDAAVRRRDLLPLPVPEASFVGKVSGVSRCVARRLHARAHREAWLGDAVSTINLLGPCPPWGPADARAPVGADTAEAAIPARPPSAEHAGAATASSSVKQWTASTCAAPVSQGRRYDVWSASTAAAVSPWMPVRVAAGRSSSKLADSGRVRPSHRSLARSVVSSRCWPEASPGSGALIMSWGRTRKAAALEPLTSCVSSARDWYNLRTLKVGAPVARTRPPMTLVRRIIFHDSWCVC